MMLEGLLNFGWDAFFLLAVMALIGEFLTGTMILLSLSISLLVLSALAWVAAPAIGVMVILGAVLWVVLSLSLRRIFGSWGADTAASDPNDYDRKSGSGE
ncbi:hypothetical protein ACOI1H_16050 [Loktanella sp. DJP18]|uniref:hypothetical protein n=1 Tax=Loktanella sp. DJP18 TaxID=3409788 RepID=UPI003BB5CDC8